MELIILFQWGNALLVSSGVFQKLKEFLTVHVTRGLVTLPVQAKHTFKVGFMAVFDTPSNLASILYYFIVHKMYSYKQYLTQQITKMLRACIHTYKTITTILGEMTIISVKLNFVR